MLASRLPVLTLLLLAGCNKLTDADIAVVDAYEAGICCGPSCCLIEDGDGNPANNCRSTGAVNPNNACEVCNPARSQTQWSVASGKCLIGGTTCVDAGEDDPSNECRECIPATSQTAYSAKAGTPACTADAFGCTSDVCVSGTCSHPVLTGCLIANTCIMAGAVNPSNPCEECDPNTSTTSYTQRATGSPCGDPQSCSAGEVTAADTCDATGMCIPGATTSCGAYATCDLDDCATMCDAPSDCTVDADCINDECVAQRADGEQCTNDNQCLNGNCVDNVCCATACDGSCMACAHAFTGQADGTCAAVTAGLDPRDSCADQGAASCGADGTCNGSGACRAYADGTVCVAGSCVNGDAIAAATCAGGTCGTAATSECGLYACAAGNCKASCANDVDCAAGAWCDGAVCSDENRAPVAVITGSVIVHHGEDMMLSGGSSSDPDGDDIVSYSWAQESGPAATLAGAATATLTLTAPDVRENTTLRISLTVGDGIATSAKAFHDILVEPGDDHGAPKKKDGGCAGGQPQLLAMLAVAWLAARRALRG